MTVVKLNRDHLGVKPLFKDDAFIAGDCQKRDGGYTILHELYHWNSRKFLTLDKNEIPNKDLEALDHEYLHETESEKRIKKVYDE